LDFEFNPFDEYILASASEDMTCKIWKIPDDNGIPKGHLREALVNLEGHQKKVSFSTWNPSAANIIATAAFDFSLKTWNVEDQAEVFSLTTPEQVTHIKWNYTGSMLAITSKDKTLRIVDPRENKLVSGCKIHDGIKASKVEWLGSASETAENFKLVTTGFSSQAERQIGVWDMRKFSSTIEEEVEPLNLLILDQGTGALFPFYDHGTQMLYVAGKGDGNVRFFESAVEEPYMHYISDYRSTVPQKGFCFMPKRCVDVGTHEIMRGLKLESTSVVPISFKVPRKSSYSKRTSTRIACP
jgi:WD40 repeat protein